MKSKFLRSIQMCSMNSCTHHSTSTRCKRTSWGRSCTNQWLNHMEVNVPSLNMFLITIFLSWFNSSNPIQTISTNISTSLGSCTPSIPSSFMKREISRDQVFKISSGTLWPSYLFLTPNSKVNWDLFNNSCTCM
jgi:hypothetical protein